MAEQPSIKGKQTMKSSQQPVHDQFFVSGAQSHSLPWVAREALAAKRQGVSQPVVSLSQRNSGSPNPEA
jgi:hypothetical protein